MKRGHALRILLVEDEEDSRNALYRLLASEGHEVHPCGDYDAALDVAGRESIDLLITDIGLPERDGYELMVAIKRLYAFPGIALTGHVTDDEQTLCKEAGFLGFLRKPIEFAALLDTLATIERRPGINHAVRR